MSEGKDVFRVKDALQSLAWLRGYAWILCLVVLWTGAAIPAYAQGVNKKASELKEADELIEKFRTYFAQGKYDEAVPLAERALALRERHLSPGHLDVAVALSALGVLCWARGDYGRAEPLYARALAIREKTLGLAHPDVATSLEYLAILYDVQGQYESAEPLHKRALAIREQVLGSEHPVVAQSLNNLAILYEQQGEYRRAELLHERALAIQEKSQGPDHLQVASTLHGLANLYEQQGEYERAELFFKRSLAIKEKVLGPEHSEVALTLHNLAIVYLDRGEYERAEGLHERALAINVKALGPVHPAVAQSLNNLANVFFSRGEYERAALFHERALAIQEKSLGPDHLQVALSLNNLAGLYIDLREYKRAEALLKRALAIREKVLEPQHPHVATCLGNLAQLYQVQGEYERAEHFHERARAILEKALGPQHPHVATALADLAELYRTRREYKRAEHFHKRALAIRENVLGLEHPNTAESLHSLAVLYWTSNDTERALNFAGRALAVRERGLSVLLATGSEDQKYARLAVVQAETDQNISFHLQAAPDDPQTSHLMLEMILQRKSRVLDATVAAIQALRQQIEPEGRARLDELHRLRSALATRLLRGPEHELDTYRSHNQELRERINTLEDELSKRSRSYREATRPATVEDVQAQLPANAALVEFVLYRPYDPDVRGPEVARWEAPRYAAYVLHNDGAPRAVDLGEAAIIDKLVRSWRTALQMRHADVRLHAEALDAQMMKPVRTLLGDVQQIFLAPDGDLNLIPFAALVDETGDHLIERYQITYLTSGRDLLAPNILDSARQGPVVFANPLFDIIDTVPPPLHDATQPDDVPSGSRDLVGLTVKPLPGTAKEAQTLASVLPNLEVWTGAEATEDRVSQLHGPEILHIATHGIWLEDAQPVSTDIIDVTRQSFMVETPSPTLARLSDPMVRSGLALAGFNSRRHGADDGFLTALEAASLDLYGTRLVVLSACDTGLGEVKSGQGVYGLRRALVVAGSETQVMSLWRVSDAATVYIMGAYYRHLRKGAGRSEAMRQIQLEMLKDPQRRHPFYWASFIVSGNPMPLYGKPQHPGRIRPTGGCACNIGSSANESNVVPPWLLFLFCTLFWVHRQRRSSRIL